MKVIHVFNSSLVSGPETLVLPALRHLSHPVEIVFLSETRKGDLAQRPVDYSRGLGLETSEVSVRSRLDFRAIAELRRLLQDRRPAIVHAHDVKASTYTWLASCVGRDWKLVSTHHSVNRVGLKLRAYERLYSSFVMRRFDRGLTVCTEDRDILVRRGYPPEKIEVHLNGVDRPKVELSERAQARSQIHEAWRLKNLGVSENAMVMGIAARLDPEKNHEKGLEVLAQLRAIDPTLDWHVLCFGAGQLESRLKKRTLELGLQDRVHWMGYCSGLGSQLAGLDLLLSFSTAEGLPINLLEAGWAGTPVIAVPAQGVKDLIRPGVDGEYFSWNFCEGRGRDESVAKILSLLRDVSRLQRQGRYLQERVETAFSQNSWLAFLERLYTTLA